MAHVVRLVAPFGVVALFGAAFGCVIAADIDEHRITQGAGGSSVTSSSIASSSASSSSSSSTGGVEFACSADGDCPGIVNECGKPRCFSDGLCGFDNEPIGAPCTENGGHACDGKGQCVECTANEHCANGKCGPDRSCFPPTCSDKINNGDETDVDCGGSCPARCGPLEKCIIDGDCVGGICEAGVCAPSCGDQKTNKNETDTDCGGPDCAPCGLGQICNVAADCSSGLCDAGICVPVSTCTDGVANGAETGIDCGGVDCIPCGNGQPCLMGSDCASHSCVMGLCAEPSCSDGVQNGGEVAIDCGATCPTGCPTGTSCTVAQDCASKKCEGPAGNTVCGAPSCYDGIWNGDEAAWDCGGSCTVKCPPLYPCRIHEDCHGGICDPVSMTCAPTCYDGYPNQGETDPDCGGPCPMKCPLGWHCVTNDDCVTGLSCTQGHCLP